MVTNTDGSSPGWDAYGLVFVAILVAFSVPLLLHVVGRLLNLWPQAEKASEETPPRQAEVPPEGTINTRYFTAAQMAGIVGLPLFMLLPLLSSGPQVAGLAVLSIGICGGAALVYANRKGDLRWNDALSREGNEEPFNKTGGSP